MIKGLMFFIKFSWQREKRYLVYRIVKQFISSMIPIVAVIMPRFIINELLGEQRASYLALYIGILIGYTFAATTLSNWLQWTGFMHRIKISQGFEPSGGEGQKIALARALFKNAPIIILDEPAAALDPRAEYEMYQNFNTLVKGKTAVYISHRLSSARFCDTIAVFQSGKIVEYGSHEDLLRQNGLYCELWNMQAAYYTVP